jgi:YidC/Oxa1 family membrane protein insertase
VDFGFLAQVWATFWGLLLNILVGINSVVHVPGLSIIVFTLFMRLLTVPLTMKSLRSSRNMQQIQPLIKEIQKKYAKDRQKQQEETMKLYHEYGINPAAGCFPMLIQLPIFIGLYSALQFTLQHGTDPAALKSMLFVDSWIPYANFNQPFLWLSSLAQADPLHIWPVLSGVFQFIQSRMSMPVRDPNQPQDPQQRMMFGMMQLMPIYIVFISLGFPAGTVIYWAFSSLFGAVQQYFITGFGTLPDLPGLSFLPRKAPVQPTPLQPKAPAERQASRGVMGWMMDRALQAQEAQKAAQPNGNLTETDGAAIAAAEDGASTVRVKASGKAGGLPAKKVPKAHHYVVDGAESENGLGNGASDEIAEPTIASVYSPQLPRKRRGKK